MRRCVLSLVAALVLSLAIAGTASATPTSPGPRDATNCVGQTSSFMAQKFAGIGEPGLAYTSANSTPSRTVQEEATWIREVRCNP